MLVALLLYGLFSAPAPQQIGLAELAIALSLIVASGLRQPLALASGALLTSQDARVYELTGCIAFQWLLWAPLLRGAALDWEMRDILRDIVPMLYLFLPVLLTRRLHHLPHRAVTMLSIGLASAGAIFVIRWWVNAGWAFGAIGHRALEEGPYYLLNSPAVLFAAIWLPIAAARLLWPVLGKPALGRPEPGRHELAIILTATAALILTATAALILAALAGTVHRMALALVVVSGLIYIAWSIRRSPWPAALTLAGLAVLSLLPDGPLIGAFELIMAKSQQVGWNERFNEANAVLVQIDRSVTSLLLGDGWGALVANPAVGGWRVSYTHSFASYLLLKTGVLGTLAMLCWLASLTPAAITLVRRDLPLALALLPPLLGGLLLHTSFKYLCFGLLLTLMVVASEREADST